MPRDAPAASRMPSRAGAARRQMTAIGRMPMDKKYINTYYIHINTKTDRRQAHETLDPPARGIDLGRFRTGRRDRPPEPADRRKVLQAVREVRAGKVFCLSLPLDLPGGNVLNPRRHPPALAPRAATASLT